MLKRYDLYQIVATALLIAACSSGKKAGNSAAGIQAALNDSALQHAHVGIIVVDAESGQTLAAYNEHRYFVPASNTKLWTCYAGMRYLGDSLVAGYLQPMDDKTVLFKSVGDPTFLHHDYPNQPLAEQLKKYQVVQWQNAKLQTTEYGNGWSWNDYDATYMAPRSSMPLFGNEVTYSVKEGALTAEPAAALGLVGNASSFKDTAFTIFRKFDDPYFTMLEPGRSKRVNTTLFMTPQSASQLAATHFGNDWYFEPTAATGQSANSGWKAVHSQPTDSMLKPLMHRSDNFFAEQTLLMISQQWFGVMNENKVIDSLLKTDLKELPDKPRWVDGSGLSRYNLFTPADYIWLLRRMQQNFGMERLKEILPTGNDGTLSNYYKSLEGKLFAKTGTLAGVVALSGYLYAKSGKLLYFSTMVNNHNGSAPVVRRAIEKYLLTVWEKN
jgi:D-alanyl-D-alanine carboxypeptidase/D-alanyl-D-alanine-endopeptidase (penicillin-binding protein 4)